MSDDEERRIACRFHGTRSDRRFAVARRRDSRSSRSISTKHVASSLIHNDETHFSLQVRCELETMLKQIDDDADAPKANVNYDATMNAMQSIWLDSDITVCLMVIFLIE